MMHVLWTLWKRHATTAALLQSYARDNTHTAWYWLRPMILSEDNNNGLSTSCKSSLEFWYASRITRS